MNWTNAVVVIGAIVVVIAVIMLLSANYVGGRREKEFREHNHLPPL
jgi:hypothetical protein